MFRGFHQHDTQEFLRCFMDQLHEELKEPELEAVPSRRHSYKGSFHVYNMIHKAFDFIILLFRCFEETECRTKSLGSTRGR